MGDIKPPLVAELLWAEGLRFGAAGPSPMQLAAFELAGCMASDVAEILTRGRHQMTALSREKYCSVWHSMRPDIAFTTAFDIHP